MHLLCKQLQSTLNISGAFTIALKAGEGPWRRGRGGRGVEHPWKHGELGILCQPGKVQPASSQPLLPTTAVSTSGSTPSTLAGLQGDIPGQVSPVSECRSPPFLLRFSRQPGLPSHLIPCAGCWSPPPQQP